MSRSNGVVLWESEDVVAIATGLARPSANAKTGPMVQTWILNARRPPHEPGAELVVCGDGTVVPKGAERPAGDVWCPASSEGGFRSTCQRCGLCAGTSANAASVAIQAHGSGAGKLPVLQA